jgi:hypothetical protein
MEKLFILPFDQIDLLLAELEDSPEVRETVNGARGNLDGDRYGIVSEKKDM